MTEDEDAERAKRAWNEIVRFRRWQANQVPTEIVRTGFGGVTYHRSTHTCGDNTYRWFIEPKRGRT